MEIVTPTIKGAYNLKTTQRDIESMMVGLSLRDHITNTEIKVLKLRTGRKWSWVGYIAHHVTHVKALPG